MSFSNGNAKSKLPAGQREKTSILLEFMRLNYFANAGGLVSLRSFAHAQKF
jgi:hypothetical protein